MCYFAVQTLKNKTMSTKNKTSIAIAIIAITAISFSACKRGAKRATDNVQTVSDTCQIVEEPETEEFEHEIYIEVYDDREPSEKAKEAYNIITANYSADMFFVNENPFNIDDYIIAEDVIQRGYEGDPDIHEYALYIVRKNGHDLMNIFGEEILIISETLTTSRNIGVNSTIEEFVEAYPEYGIFYTYVSSKYWLAKDDKTPQIQFILDNDDALTEWDGSIIQHLKPSDFKPNSKITKIRLYGSDMMYLY